MENKECDEGLSELECEIIEKITPKIQESEALRKSAEALKDVTEKFIKEENLSVSEVRFVGSYAKDTYLSNPDLDLFLMFPPNVSRDQLEKEGLFIGEKILNGERLYAEHPYIRGVFEGYNVDMVPCYDLKNTKRLKTSVDRTPFHTEYVLSRMKPGDHGQVRLLKKFMKGISVYGAEPDVRGFSGYLCELLILKYGGFKQTIKAASDWKEGIVIDIEGSGSAIDAPLTVYDPVDPERNASSAVHLDTLSMFIVASKAYIEKPSEKFFFPEKREPLSVKELVSITRSLETKLLTVIFERPDIVEENISSQLWKTQYALSRKLDEFGFKVLRAVHDSDEKLWIIFELERDNVPKTFKHSGPPVWVRHSENFLKKWKENVNGKPFIEDGKWNVIANRPYTNAKNLIREEAAMSGVGREFDIASMIVLDHEETIEEVRPILLTDLLDPVLSWEV